MRRSALLVPMIAALALAAPARAMPPETAVLTLPPGEPEVIGNCGGSPITAQFSVTIQRTVFYDEAGTVVRIRREITLDGTVTNVDTGKSVAVQGVRVLTETAEEFKATGSGVHVVVPGFGTVAIEAGIERETADGYVAHGRREPFTDKLCAALAP
jgi:hypothetical protein